MAPKVTPEAKPGRGNGYDPDTAKNVVERIDGCFKELDSLRGEYMHDCKSVREDMASIYDEAKDKGIPKKELKAVIKARILERKAEKVRDDLEGESVETFDQIRHALGDLSSLPLGEAALARSAA